MNLSSQLDATANQSSSFRDTSYFRSSHSDNFYDIDDILASQSKVACTFNLPVYRLGYLNTNSKAEHIEPDTKIELPMWLGQALSGRRNIASLDVPKYYSLRYREELLADANSLNLFKMGPYFYKTGVKFLSHDHPESDAISEILIKTFCDRFRNIMDIAHNSYEKDTLSLVANLDETEKELFYQGKKTAQAVNDWKTQRDKKISSSSLVKINRKRPHQA